MDEQMIENWMRDNLREWLRTNLVITVRRDGFENNTVHVGLALAPTRCYANPEVFTEEEFQI